MSETRPAASVPASEAAARSGRSATHLVRRSLDRLNADSLLRNSLFIMATTVINSVLGYGFWVAAARWYPAAAVGVAAGLVAAMLLVSIIASLGLSFGLTQELPRCAAGRPWSTMVSGSLLTGACAGAAVGLLVGLLLPFISPPLATGPLGIAVFVFGTASATVAGLLDYTFIAERAAHHMLVRNAAFGLVKFIVLIVCAVLVTRSPLGLFGVWVVTAAASIALAMGTGIPRLGKRFRPALAGAGSQLRRLAPSLAGHYLAMLGSVLPMYVLPLEVVARRPTAENAYFYVTWMMSGMFMMVSPAVASSLFAEGSHTPGEIRATAMRSLRTIAALLVPAAAVFLVAGRTLLSAFGPAYAKNGWPLLIVMVASAAPDAVTNVAVTVLRVERRLVEASILNVFMGVVAVALTWVLLPTLGIVGAGIGWLASQAAGTVLAGASLLFRRTTTLRDVHGARSESGDPHPDELP